MTSEQPPRDALRPLRPLPSIDVPLLRSERSAFRNKQLARWTIVFTVLFAVGASLAIAGYFGSRDAEPKAPGEQPQPASTGELAAVVAEDLAAGGTEREQGEPPVVAQPTPEEPVAPVLHTTTSTGESRSTHTFGKAGSFRDALERAGLEREESTTLISALTGTIDFRRSHPEDVFSFERASDGTLTGFEYRASLTQRYEATLEASGKWKARQVDVPIRRQRTGRAGIVVGSLGDTLEGLKLGRTLTGVFGEVFEGKVNFSTDTRTGDEFRIIFDEEYVEGTFLRYGAVHAVEYKGDKVGLLRAFWHDSKDDGDFYDEHGRAMHGGWLRTPLRYDHISSGYGMRKHPVLKIKKLHNGIDYAAASGTAVRAAAAGTVTFAGTKGPNGNLVVLSHAQGYETFYAHLSRFASGLKTGAKVAQRQLIAYVGTTGRSTGPHLHFSLKRHGKFLDPQSQLNGPGLPMTPHALVDFKRRVRELTTALGKLTPERPAPVQPVPALDPTDLGEEEL